MLGTESPAVIKQHQDLNEQHVFYETHFVNTARLFESSFHAKNYTDEMNKLKLILQLDTPNLRYCGYSWIRPTCVC